MTNPLQRIMDDYRIVLDSMRVTGRVLRKNIRDAITQRHVFRYMDVPSAMERLTEAERSLSDFAVLSLVAAFERMVRDHVKRRPARLLEGGDPIALAIHAEILQDIEYWRISDRLVGVFRERVDPLLVGNIKQIVGYRNWVAHGRATSEPPDGIVSPGAAFEQLTRFLVDAGIIDQG